MCHRSEASQSAPTTLHAKVSSSALGVVKFGRAQQVFSIALSTLASNATDIQKFQRALWLTRLGDTSIQKIQNLDFKKNPNRTSL